MKVKTDNNDTIIASYTYGDSNERLILEEAGVRTYYACDGSAEYTESGSSTTPQWSKTYIYLAARLLSTLTPNGSGQFVQYHHPDRLGTRLVTNAQDTNYFEANAAVRHCLKRVASGWWHNRRNQPAVHHLRPQSEYRTAAKTPSITWIGIAIWLGC